MCYSGSKSAWNQCRNNSTLHNDAGNVDEGMPPAVSRNPALKHIWVNQDEDTMKMLLDLAMSPLCFCYIENYAISLGLFPKK